MVDDSLELIELQLLAIHCWMLTVAAADRLDFVEDRCWQPRVLLSMIGAGQQQQQQKVFVVTLVLVVAAKGGDVDVA
jgi:hypothetical protein